MISILINRKINKMSNNVDFFCIFCAQIWNVGTITLVLRTDKVFNDPLVLKISYLFLSMKRFGGILDF